MIQYMHIFILTGLIVGAALLHMEYIDLRSDTVTHPTQEMREAIFNAEVGDDYYRDDATVNQLEEEVAELTGMEAACLVPTGVFGNQCAMLTHTNRGQVVILANESHIIQTENGSLARISGLLTTTPKTKGGILTFQQVQSSILIQEKLSLLSPVLSTLALQNPTALGRVYPMEEFKRICEFAHQHKLKIHLDGARLFSACTYLNVEAKEICQHVDSVMFCLSKGLCAPVGSIVAGSKAFIDKFRWNRKSLGGGLRQAGYIAAPGLLAIRQMRHHVRKDHEMATMLSRLLREVEGVEIMDEPQISILYFRVNVDVSFEELGSYLKKHKIHMFLPKSNRDSVKVVTHHYIREKEVEFVVEKIRQFLEGKASRGNT